MSRAGWSLPGTTGAGEGGNEILVRAGSRDSVSYAFDRRRGVCAELSTPGYFNGEPPGWLLDRHRGRSLIRVDLLQDRDRVVCDQPRLLRLPSIQ